MHDDMKDAVDSLDTQADPSTFVASNGLRLKLRRVSQMIMTDAARRITSPKPPRVFLEEKGREEENPNDPTYVEAVRNYRYDLGTLTVNTYFVLGTKPIDPLPQGISPVDSEDWPELLRVVDPDIDIPAAGPRRYLAWLKYHALADHDLNELLQQCIRYSGGTLEVDVIQAQATFRSFSPRDTPDPIRPPTEDRFRDNSGEDPGHGAGVRGEGGGGLRALPMGEVAGVIEL